MEGEGGNRLPCRCSRSEVVPGLVSRDAFGLHALRPFAERLQWKFHPENPTHGTINQDAVS